MGTAIAEGRDVDPAGMRSAEAAVAAATAKVLRRYLDHPTRPGEKPANDRTPPGLDKGAIGQMLVKELPDGRIIIDKSTTILAAAAKALDSTRLERGHAADTLARARKAGKRVLPAAVTSDMPAGERGLRQAANEVIARTYGKGQTRHNGPTVAPLLWGMAVYQAGKSLQGDEVAPGSIELAAASVEGLDRSLHHSFAGEKYSEGGVPWELTDVQQEIAGVKAAAIQERIPREDMTTRLAGVAAAYTARFDSQRSAAAAARQQLAADSAAASQEQQQRPALQKAAAEQYADTLILSAHEVAAEAQTAIDDIAAMQLRRSDLPVLRQQRQQGDPRAAEALTRYEQGMRIITRSTAALIDHRLACSPDAARALEDVLGSARSAVVRHAYGLRDDIAQGRGVTPEVAKIVACQTPLTTVESRVAPALQIARTATERRMVDTLRDALTDAAFIRYEGGSHIRQEVGDTTEDTRIAETIRDKNVPGFVREAYIDELSPAPQPGERGTLLAVTRGLRLARMYAEASKISDVQALPRLLLQKYTEVMEWGENHGKRQRQDRRTQQARSIVAPAGSLMKRLLPTEKGWN